MMAIWVVLYAGDVPVAGINGRSEQRRTVDLQTS
jgi:hypothetical protein